MNFVGKTLPITRQGLIQALANLGMPPSDSALLWAVFEVETAGVTQGFGFRVDRRPQILFERHKFRALTKRQFDKSDPDLSGPQGAYGPLSQQYTKIERALALCKEADLGVEPAICAASWGIGQVMGFNHRAAGFPTAQAMVNAMVDSEDAQLLSMVGFLRDSKLDDALRAHNWAKFARGYNGPLFAQNRYDIKLEVQYARFSSGSLPDIELRTAQAALTLLGFQPGKIDGLMGKRTREALRGFQTTADLTVNGELDSATYAALRASAGF